MLAGEAVVAIWNGIAPEGREEFYAWHIHEHMPERLGIPGFRRGRRYRSLDNATQPEFFTLYEVDTFQVLQGQDYANRLNAPTSWTRKATSHFRDTSRALARVLGSHGKGPGGVLLTLRFDVPIEAAEQTRKHLLAILPQFAEMPQIGGAHLCRADPDASDAKTNESKDRPDIKAPPRWFLMFEACTPGALGNVSQLAGAEPCLKNAVAGRYVMEFTRLKTEWAAG
ncbi:MAG TPA: hypothetical protein VGQ19_06150 [Burkholderiales bacterium]|jgi:hypothetical protein|nr:hypothetical protein [Burkholderiales bacterium]